MSFPFTGYDKWPNDQYDQEILDARLLGNLDFQVLEGDNPHTNVEPKED
jgi:hypothetical protein